MNTCVNKDNTCFDKNVGVVTVNTSCSTLPLCEPIDENDPQAYFQTVDAVLQLGVPNHRGAHIPLRLSFDWDFFEENIQDYHNNTLSYYIMFGFPLGLSDDHLIKSNARDNHSSARDYPQAVTEYVQLGLQEGALPDPFQQPPHTSRVILDLSFGDHSENNNTETCYDLFVIQT